jgi:hypothetical protein
MAFRFEPLPEKVNVLIARLSYSGLERVEVGTWAIQVAGDLDAHPRVNNVLHITPTGYPTSLVRNNILVTAKKAGAHFVVMIDDDMVPDCHSPQRATHYESVKVMADQKNFLPSALDFALDHNGPCVIGAPYCAAPPHERVLVSRFRERESETPSATIGTAYLESYTREEAAERTGFEMVSALPTGLMLIDMRVLGVLSPPWFTYEYKSELQNELASTEDTVFSRNLMFLDVPQYVAWSSWAGHWKGKVVGRPRSYPRHAIPAPIEKRIRQDLIDEIRNARPGDVRNETALAYLTRTEVDDTPPVEPLTEDYDRPS